MRPPSSLNCEIRFVSNRRWQTATKLDTFESQ